MTKHEENLLSKLLEERKQPKKLEESLDDWNDALTDFDDDPVIGDAVQEFRSLSDALSKVSQKIMTHLAKQPVDTEPIPFPVEEN